MYCGERFEKNCCIAKIHWLRCIRRGVICSYKEDKAVSYLSMNVIIQTDGPVVLTKPPRTRRGELDLSSEEQTRILNADTDYTFKRKLWATCRWMPSSERTGLWSSRSRREQEEASLTSAAKSRHRSSMQRNFRVFKMQVLLIFA